MAESRGQSATTKRILQLYFRHFPRETLAFFVFFFEKKLYIGRMLKTIVMDIRNFLNGSIYGMTLIIPGVSATLLAIILKFYDEVIHVVNHFREDYRKNARYAGVFVLGIAAGAVLFSSLIVFLLDNYPLPTILLFTGLLVGMIPLIAEKAAGLIPVHPGQQPGQKPGQKPQITPRKIALTAFFLVALVALSCAVPADVVDPAQAMGDISLPLILYFALGGILNGATLVIPGLSGAFLLLVMGLYPLFIFSISSIGDFFLDMSNLSLLRDITTLLLPYGVGAVFGFLGMARLMEKLLRDFPNDVYAAILGLLIGSVITLFTDQVLVHSGTPALVIAAGALLFCAGCAAAYILSKRH